MCRPDQENRYHSPTMDRESPPVDTDQRRVSFGGVQVVGNVTPRCSMSIQERRNRWYQKQDYRDFRTSMSRLTSHYQENHYRHKLGLDDDDDDDEDEEQCMRGLERRMSCKRQRLKDLAVDGILRAQDDGYSPREIATVARERSSWATDLAIRTGRNDYNFVYHPSCAENENNHYLLMEESLQRNEDHQDSSSDEEMDTFTIPSLKRRVVIDACEPSKRRRLSRPLPMASSGPLVRRRRIPMWQPESWVSVS